MYNNLYPFLRYAISLTRSTAVLTFPFFTFLCVFLFFCSRLVLAQALLTNSWSIGQRVGYFCQESYNRSAQTVIYLNFEHQCRLIRRNGGKKPSLSVFPLTLKVRKLKLWIENMPNGNMSMLKNSHRSQKKSFYASMRWYLGLFKRGTGNICTAGCTTYAQSDMSSLDVGGQRARLR